MKNWQKKLAEKKINIPGVEVGWRIEDIKEIISQVEADAYERASKEQAEMSAKFYEKTSLDTNNLIDNVRSEAYEVAFRFWSKVDRSKDCWEWEGSKSFGYGRFSLTHDKWVKAHRFAYEKLVCEIPEGKVIDHLCRNRACVNPEHMEVVTLKENVLRGEGITAVNARKTNCIRGHEYTPENTIKQGENGRKCRECANANGRRSRAKRALKE